METNNYDTIADLYDTYVPATFDIPFFLGEAKKVPGEVLELMSGTGRLSLPLIEAGVRLTCVDLSREMLKVLEEKLVRRGLSARVYPMDICELDLGRQFDLVLIPFHSFAEIVSPEDQRRALERIHRHLTPGGSFICTLGNPAVRRQTVDGKLRFFRRYPLDGQRALLLWLLENLHPADNHIVEMLEFFEEYDENGMLCSKRLLELRFRLSSRGEFEALACSAGFAISALYGDYSYSEFREDSSPSMVWVLKKG